MAALTLLAVGKLNNGDLELQSASLFQERDVVEHCVNRWTDEKWVAEARVNGRMMGRSIFTGTFAYEDAKAWCDLIAPMAAGRPLGAAVRR